MKFVNENISDFLKPKSEDSVKNGFKNMSAELQMEKAIEHSYMPKVIELLNNKDLKLRYHWYELAIENKNLNILKLLLNRINPDDEFLNNLLRFASWVKDENIIEFLNNIKYGTKYK